MRESSPEELMKQAKQIAEQLLSMPEHTRYAELAKLASDDHLLYTLIRRELDRFRGSARGWENER